MAGFLYFFPDEPAVHPNRAADLQGPAKALVAATFGNIALDTKPAQGPGKTVGLLAALAGPRQPVVEYVPKTQTWHAVRTVDAAAAAPVYWIGFETANRPTPEDLERKANPLGSPVRLGDGNEWIVPEVAAHLPIRFCRRGSEFQPQYLPEHQPLVDRARDWYRRFEADSIAYLPSEYFEFVADVLALNYRVGRDELSGDVLDLIREDHFLELMKATLGLKAVADQAAAKKKG